MTLFDTVRLNCTITTTASLIFFEGAVPSVIKYFALQFRERMEDTKTQKYKFRHYIDLIHSKAPLSTFIHITVVT